MEKEQSMHDTVENQEKIKEILLHNWKNEIISAKVYRALAEREQHTRRKEILMKLADAEIRHASKWALELQKLGATTPPEDTVKLPLKLRVAVENATIEDVLAMRESEENREVRETYNRPLGVTSIDKLMQEIRNEEASHAETIRTLIAPYQASVSMTPEQRLAQIFSREKKSGRGRSWVGEAIYGSNDGLAAVFGIVAGVSGATGGSHFVLISGLAGMIASALSMGSGSFLATKAEHELYEAELARERMEIEQNPEEEIEELSLFYQLKGLPEEHANTIAQNIAKDPELMLKTMATEELGLPEEMNANPLSNAAVAALSTAAGAIIPVIPFIFMSGYLAVIVAAAISLIAHFLVGVAKSFLTLRSWLISGLEMTIAGIVVGAGTYLAGFLFYVH
jgi:predicted membrane protein (TIGR00267 family)